MSAFEFFFSFYGLILGLSVAEVITGLVRVFKTRRGRATSTGARVGCEGGGGPLELTPEQHGLTCRAILDNYPVSLSGRGARRRDAFCSGIASGGLFSMDNMHPSSAGYAILAEAVRVEINDSGLFPPEILARGRDCPDVDPPEQQCTALLVEPGYLTTDNNLREVEFLAWSGDVERRRLNFARRLAKFMQNF